MFRYKLKELITEKENREGRIVHLKTIASDTGIGINTLSRLKNSRPGDEEFNTKILDKLCEYFDCDINELVERIPGQK